MSKPIDVTSESGKQSLKRDLIYLFEKLDEKEKAEMDELTSANHGKFPESELYKLIKRFFPNKYRWPIVKGRPYFKDKR